MLAEIIVIVIFCCYLKAKIIKICKVVSDLLFR